MPITAKQTKNANWDFDVVQERLLRASGGKAPIYANVRTDTDEVLGIHMIGPRVADLIHAAVVAMEFRTSAEDLAIFSTAHPTYAEALKEAALDATAKRSLHM